MAQPTGGDLFVSRPLTNVSVAYMQDATEFAAAQIFKPVPVKHSAGIYWKYNKGEWFRTAAQPRAPRTESAGSGWNMTTDTYLADVKALHVDISDQDRADQEADNEFDMDSDATIFITNDLLLRREKDWIAAFFLSTPWSTTAQTGVAAGPGANQFLQWNNSASTPIEDIEEQRLLIAAQTGRRPNVLAIGPEVYSVWKNHPQFIERIKYSERGVVTLDLIASLMDLEKIVVLYGVENTAAEGATDSIGFIAGKSALLAYSPPNPSKRTPSAGYTFEWTGYLGAANRGARVKKFRLEQLASDRIEGETAYGMKVVSPDLAVFFATAVA